MINRIKKIAKDNRGGTYIILMIIVLCIMMITSVCMEYLRIQFIAKGVREALQKGMASVATENYDALQYSIQDSYAGAYSSEGELQINQGQVMQKLDELLALDESHTSFSNGRVEFQLSELEIDVRQSKFNPSKFGDQNVSGRYEMDGKLKIMIPYHIGFKMNPVEIELKTSAGWGSKY